MKQRKDDSKQKQNSQLMNAISIAAGAGLTLFACLAIGLLCGYKFDQMLQLSFPVGTLLGGLLGALASIISIYRQIR